MRRRDCVGFTAEGCSNKATTIVRPRRGKPIPLCDAHLEDFEIRGTDIVVRAS